MGGAEKSEAVDGGVHVRMERPAGAALQTRKQTGRGAQVLHAAPKLGAKRKGEEPPARLG